MEQWLQELNYRVVADDGRSRRERRRSTEG